MGRCSWTSHSYSRGPVRSRNGGANKRVGEVRQLILEERKARLDKKLKSIIPGKLRNLFVNRAELIGASFWSGFRMDCIPRKSLAMLVCRALIPIPNAYCPSDSSDFHPMRSPQPVWTWSNASEVVPLLIIHYSRLQNFLEL